MLFEQTITNAKAQDPQLEGLWKLVLNANLNDSQSSDLERKKQFEKRIEEIGKQEGIQI
jgi:hypothetical protein